jgi:hypothetical protein
MCASTLGVAANATAAPEANSSISDAARQLSEKYKDTGIFVVDGAGEAAGDATFYALPDNAKGALIITPAVAKEKGLKGGKVAKGEESRVFEAVAGPATSTDVQPMSSYTTSFWAPIGGGWSNSIQRRAVHNHPTSKYYYWDVDPIASGTVCTQGTGWYTGYNGGSFGLWKNWYGLGCGTSGAGVYVPWDNVMAYPEFMAKSMQVYWGVPGAFE